MKKYPKTIYISRENEGDSEEYLQHLNKPHEVDLNDFNKRIVAIYKLSGHVEVEKQIKVTGNQ